MPLAGTKKLEDDGTVVKVGGYRYRDNETNTKMVEYHVDTCVALDTQVNHTPFGGNLRDRFPGGKPFILVGHNECIFKQ